MGEQDQSAGTSAIKECPKCSTKMRITDALRGKRIKCPGCSVLLKISEDGEVSVPVMTTFINAKVCPECSTRMRITENLHDKKIKCPKCTTMLQISSSGDVTLAEPVVEETPEDDEGDTQNQFIVDAMRKEVSSESSQFDDDDDEQLTVGDDDDEPEPPARQMKDPLRIQLRPPEQDDEPDDMYEETPVEKPVEKLEESPAEKPTEKEFSRDNTEIFLEKDIPIKRFNALMYMSFIIAVILLVITLIDVFTNFNVITTPIYGKPVVTEGSGSPEIAKEKSEYEIAFEYADKAQKCFEKAMLARKDTETWTDENKKAAILVDFDNAVTNYLKAEKLLYKLSIDNINKDGLENGDMIGKTDDELVQTINKCKNAYIKARYDVELNYIFMNKMVAGLIDELVKAFDEYSELVKEKSSDYVFDNLLKHEIAIFKANEERIATMLLLKDLLEELTRIDGLETSYKKLQRLVEKTAEKFFVNSWKTINEYYKYVQFARDNELLLKDIVMTMNDVVEKDDMNDIENALSNLDIVVDRNLDAAANLRQSVETLKEDVGTYGYIK